MIEVRFQYDEASRKWAVLVTGCKTPEMAREAFAAVILTCDQIHPDLQRHALTKETQDGHAITPAV